MFRASSFHTIDSKGRLIVPARFRELIKNGDTAEVMLTKLDGGLMAYPMQRWLEIEGKILALEKKSATMRRFRRVFVGGAAECPCDKQDRILIPPLLRDYAGLEKEIVIVGALDHFEIWSKQYWERENSDLEKDMQQEGVRSEIAEIGL